MTTHTPGPWEVAPKGTGLYVVRALNRYGNEDYVAKMIAEPADAKLIAAAPTLLEAASQLLAQHDAPHGFNDDTWYGHHREALRRAIAQARGETS